MAGPREGNLEAPTRHPLGWESPQFWDEHALFEELERVFDICHGCRRCVSLCQSFPTLFDLVDESESMEVDGVAKADYWKVVDQCYLCDLCYMTKCPYVPPHEWNLDFPHLMLRAKAFRHKEGETKLRDKALTSTDLMGALANPVTAPIVNAANRNATLRRALQNGAGIAADAWLPEFTTKKLRKRLSNLVDGNWLDIAWAADGEMLWLVAPRARAAQPALPTPASHAPTLVPPRQINAMAGTYTPPPMAAARPGALDFQRVGSVGYRC